MNRKIPTAIATLIAAFSVAVAIAPVASAGKVLPPNGSTTTRPNATYVVNDLKIGNRSQF